MFYNTGIGTYLWIVTNRKEKRRKKKIQLLDARDIWTIGGSEESKRSLGDKRRHLTGIQIDEIVRLYGRLENGERSKIFDNDDFGYTRVTVERPLRLRYQMTDERKARFIEECPDLESVIDAFDRAFGREPQRDWDALWPHVRVELNSRQQKIFRATFAQRDPEAEPVRAVRGFEPDPELRDFDNVPLKEDIDAYFEREVKPHLPDAWMDRTKDRVGYEINFNRQFYKYTPPRPLEAIDADLKLAEEEIVRLLREVTA